jgi:four helix bundle protein
VGKIKSYKDLLIWQKGIEITEKVYSITNDFPTEELFSLTNQVKRASVSIPSNIAEGFGRNSTKSYLNFLKIFRGSLYELETQLIIAEKLNYTTDSELLQSIYDLISEEGKMINSYMNKIELSNVNVN